MEILMKIATKKQMTIGKKITLSFAFVLGLMIIIGVLSNLGVLRIVKNAEGVIAGNLLDGALAQKEVDHLVWANQVNALLTDDTITTLEVQTDHRKCAFGQWLYGEGRNNAEKTVPELAPLLNEIEKPHERLHNTAISIKKSFKQADPNLPARLIAIEAEHLRWASRIRDAFLEKNTSLEDVQKDPTQCSFGKWRDTEAAKNAYAQAGEDFKKTWDELPEVHRKLHESAHTIEKLLAAGNNGKAEQYFNNVTSSLLEDTVELFQDLTIEAESELSGMNKAKHIYATETVPALHQVQNQLKKIREEAKRYVVTDVVLLNAAKTTRNMVTLFTIATLIAGVFLSYFVTRGIIKILKNISDRMNIGAEQVSTASMEVSSASASLADGSSQQAAALEEISASLEEVTAMTRNDADNAKQADILMKETAGVLTKADESMKNLIDSMRGISSASEQTQKIVKTIDEIAFQTNLLALNAAVEAARAGEAGAGFAVVADEVRNLAMRAAEAAKNTSQLIDNTVEKVNRGSSLVEDTSETFYVASQATGRISILVSEIAQSTGEQALAIQQVNKAITEIDSVTQQNAATAEEAASASEKLSAQAATAKHVVEDLIELVGGKDANKKHTVKKINKSSPSLTPSRSVAQVSPYS
jgi:methyl-accepting chemotaxis protein